MKLARQHMMRRPSLSSKIELDCCSYAARRAGPGVLALLNARSILKNAFGNWKGATEVKKQGSAMPENYTEHTLQVGFEATYLVAESTRRSARDIGSVK